MGRADPEKRRAATERLHQLADTGHLTSRHMRLAATGCGGSERTRWRWIDSQTPDGDQRSRAGYRISDADCEGVPVHLRVRGARANDL